MKKLATGLSLATALTLLPNLVQAQPLGGHYPAGSEGLKAATLPPPGLYFRDYNQFYFASDYDDGPPGFDIIAYVNAPRLIWITDFKILGGFYGMDALLPMGYVDIDSNPGGPNDSRFSIGDLFVEPITVSWHTERFDFAVGYGFWAPTGGFDKDKPAQLGKGYWSHMFTAGATWYLDKEKTWSVSALNRYEIHHEHDDYDVTPGNTWTLEWGIGKSLSKTVEAGVVGYYQAQLTDDDPSSHEKDHVAAIGPEISAFCTKLKLFASLRYLHEFSAKDRPEGHLISLTLTKPL